MQRIRRAAVIGAGTMGSQIASVIANAGTKVLLLDIVPKGANDRDVLAKEAIEKLKSSRRQVSSKDLALIQPGNMEDNLDNITEADWVIECVPEDAHVKHDTYEKVGQYLQQGAVISSNTSTIPLYKLKEGLDPKLRKQLCIAHFFNPPDQAPLLELVADQDNDPRAIKLLTGFADRMLGRNVIPAKDTPGFIGNRIGIFWMLCAFEEAKRKNIPIEVADAVLNGAFGFPRTGVFALADLIGLRLIPEMARSLCALLPGNDAFCQFKEGLKLVQEVIDKNPGGHSGFYRKLEDGGEQVFDLQNGEYRNRKKAGMEIEHWHEFLTQDSQESRFALHVLTQMLSYTVHIAPDIADSILNIDAVMRDGYGWKYGPFEMMDRLGPSWLIEQMEREHLHAPALLKEAEAKGFYRIRPGKGVQYLSFDGRYRKWSTGKGKWMLALKTAGTKPLMENMAARLWDIGNEIVCCEFTTKIGVIDERVLDLLADATETVERSFAGLVIGHDGKHFSAGLDLQVIVKSAETNDWKRVENILKQGQNCMLRIKYAKVPVIAAIYGYTLGGACELALHCSATQAHASTRMGLVETGVGVIPAWGGATELLLRTVRQSGKDSNKIVKQGVIAFRQIAEAQETSGAKDAFAKGFLNKPSRITASRERLLPDAKTLCLKLSQNYKPRERQPVEVPVKALHERFLQEINAMSQDTPLITPHRRKVLEVLAGVLSSYRAARTTGYSDTGWSMLTEQQILHSTRDAFMELVQTKETMNMIRKIVAG